MVSLRQKEIGPRGQAGLDLYLVCDASDEVVKQRNQANNICSGNAPLIAMLVMDTSLQLKKKSCESNCFNVTKKKSGNKSQNNG